MPSLNTVNLIIFSLKNDEKIPKNHKLSFSNFFGVKLKNFATKKEIINLVLMEFVWNSKL
jgi:hypothetical protein